MDSGLKKRLIGAVVLIALAVIFVPMLLPNHADDGGQAVSLKIPPEPSGEMQTRVLEVGPNGAAAGSSTAVAVHDPDRVATLDLNGHAAPPASALPQPAAPEPSIAATTEPQPAPARAAPAVASAAASSAPSPKAVAPKPQVAQAAPKPAPVANAPAASTKPQPVAGGAGAAAGAFYTVNLGIYADHASAQKLVANAKQRGFTALATPETYQGKSVLRVRVGPFRSRAEAEAARLKLKSIEPVSMTVDAGAVNQAGDAPATALAASQPGAWAVQLAAFGTEDAAKQLRDRLRAQGFDGYVDSIATASGKLWRVRAGPFASRGVAESTRGQIAQKLKIQGAIVTQQ